MEAGYQHGVPHATMRLYDDNARVLREAQREAGLAEGVRRTHYPSAKVMHKQRYLLGASMAFAESSDISTCLVLWCVLLFLLNVLNGKLLDSPARPLFGTPAVAFCPSSSMSSVSLDLPVINAPTS